MIQRGAFVPRDFQSEFHILEISSSNYPSPVSISLLIYLDSKDSTLRIVTFGCWILQIPTFKIPADSWALVWVCHIFSKKKRTDLEDIESGCKSVVSHPTHHIANLLYLYLPSLVSHPTLLHCRLYWMFILSTRLTICSCSSFSRFVWFNKFFLKYKNSFLTISESQQSYQYQRFLFYLLILSTHWL